MSSIPDLPTADPSVTDESVTDESVADPSVTDPSVTDRPATGQPATGQPATWTASDWLGKVIVDRDGERIGKLQDVYVDVETDEPQFGTVKEGFIGRHLTFVPLTGVEVGPNELRASVLKDQVKSAPDLDLRGQEMSPADESALYHHFEMNYSAVPSASGRRLARR